MGLGVACQYEPTESATNVIVRKECLSELVQRLTANERKVLQLDHLLHDHLSNCVGPRQAYSPASSAQRYHADVLEEPRDEDATTNGMAMTFTEEHTSAFFGESSNLSFTRLLLRATAAVSQSSSSVHTAIEKDSILVQSSMARLSRIHPSPLNVSSDSSDSTLTALPTTEAMENMLDIYFKTAGVVFPFIHETTMRTQYTEFKANGFSRARRTWLGTLNMMFAMASKFDLNDHDCASSKDRYDRSDVFYNRAKRLCDEFSKRVISLEVIHYLVLVVIHCQGTQRSIQAWNIHGVLVRSAIALGLHGNHNRAGLDPNTEESRRRTWLVIYGLDKLLSMVFGRPIAVTDEQMIFQDPRAWPSDISTNDSTKNVDLPGQFLAVSARLYQIMSKSLTKQYGANVDDTCSEEDQLASFHASDELRKALRLWMSNLPSCLRLCVAQSDMLLQNTQANRLRVILTLRYHNLNILINRPLLSTAIRHLFRTDTVSLGSSPYTFQLAMAGACECVQSAEITINIVHSIVTADPTSNNNLGVWFFTLYYGQSHLKYLVTALILIY